ncbi:MAG TPA: hypothetical protein VHE30_20815 [Polyangiaceae bacterium]|nr:hypothetical protein [Polyangiaceae bacterium]
MGSPDRSTRRFLALALSVVAIGGCLAKGKPVAKGSGQDLGDGGLEAFGPEDAGTCSTFGCAPLDCGPGFRGVPLPGECCPTVCESTDCSLVACAPIVCPEGTHGATSADRCCPTCVSNPKAKPGETCETGQTGYQSYYDRTVNQLGAVFCDVDSDCRIVALANACSHDCGTAVAARAASSLKSALSTYAADHCAACDLSAETCPPVERTAFCTGGVCSAH